MKGLILKDFYQLSSYKRIFVVLLLFCVLMGFTNEDTVFLTFYPAFLMGMMPITMYAYDEKAKFHMLLSSLPVKKSTYVSAKYVFALLLIVGACVLTGTVQGIKMAVGGTFAIMDFLMIMGLMIAVALVAPAVVLPFIFLLGTEKGRFVNIIVVAGTVSVINIFMNLGDDFQQITSANQIVAIVIAAAVVIFTVSWMITAKIFEKKEL